MKKGTEEPEESMLTQSMDVGTAGFDEFQATLLKKSRNRTEDQKRKIDLLTIKYEMQDYLTTDIKEEKKAGDFLKEILKKLNIQQKLFAQYLGLKPSNLNKLISGERTINYDLALIFGRLFNHSPMLWVEIQAKNELFKLHKAKENEYSTYSLNSLVNEQRAAYESKRRKKGKDNKS